MAEYVELNPEALPKDVSKEEAQVLTIITVLAPTQSNRQSHPGGVSRIPFAGFSYSAILCL